MTCISRRTFLSLCPLALGACRRLGSPPRGERMVILGIDGMDHALLTRLARQGRLPHFQGLLSRGWCRPLATSWPPQSPVAWSDFITGMDAGGHGIFDFLRHDRRTFAVTSATTAVHEPVTVMGIPLLGGRPENLRQGRPFWAELAGAGFPATLFGMPANYPPVGGGEGVRSFSGLGTPDLQGSMGTFTFYTESPWTGDEEIAGGRIVEVERREGAIRTFLEGPPLEGGFLRLPLTIHLDPENPVIRIDGTRRPLLLQVGEWSPWQRLSFPLAGGLSRVPGMVRFYLKRLRPKLALYASPVNIDPLDPALPLSDPAGAAPAVARARGAFYTQGMAEDTKALRCGVLDDGEFIRQTRLVLAERRGLLEGELDLFRRRGGLLFFYFSTLDLGSHGLWRTMDPAHPAHRRGAPSRVRDALPALYEEMDRILGRVLAAIDRRTLLMVMSDHGFSPFHRMVHLNNWLLREGYLALRKGVEPLGADLAGGVDWERTRAYAVGFNGIHLNLAGREAAGIVTREERAGLLVRLQADLEAFRDPVGGARVVRGAYPGDRVWHGPLVPLGPDLVVGYDRGYRVSWETPLGGFGPQVVEENRDAWSGDHLVDPRVVPGVLVANRPLAPGRPGLRDLPVSILEYFGIPRPERMGGRRVLAKG